MWNDSVKMELIPNQVCLVHFYPYHLSPYITYDYFKALYFDELLFYLQDLLATEKQPQPTTRYQLKPFFEPSIFLTSNVLAHRSMSYRNVHVSSSEHLLQI